MNQERELGNPLVEPQEPLVPPSNQPVLPGSRLDTQGVETALRIYEAVRAMREDVLDSLPIRELLNSADHTNNPPTFADWYQLGRDVVSLERAIERIVQQAHVSRDEPWALLQLALTIRTRWLAWRREDAHCAWRKQFPQEDTEANVVKGKTLEEVWSDFGLPNLQAEWNDIIERLRWLTAHTKATQ